jgi:hypothetical protein
MTLYVTKNTLLARFLIFIGRDFLVIWFEIFITHKLPIKCLQCRLEEVQEMLTFSSDSLVPKLIVSLIIRNVS